jgi:hypothetical protein
MRRRSIIHFSPSCSAAFAFVQNRSKRAISRRTLRTRDGIGQLTGCLLKAQLHQLFTRHRHLARLASVVRSRFLKLSSFTSCNPIIAGDDLGLDRELVLRQAQSFASPHHRKTATDFEHNPARLDHRSPIFHAPLPLPIRVSAGFWVIGLSGKMRIQIFTAALHSTHDRTTGSFNLAG